MKNSEAKKKKKKIKYKSKPVKKARAKNGKDLMNFRAPEAERKAFLAKAKKYAKGNVSAWLRFAGSNFTPKKVPASLGVTPQTSR